MTRRELKEFIYECYREFLIRRNEIALITEDADKDGEMVFGGSGAQLPTSMDQILGKFPTLKHALVRLHTEDWQEFVQNIEWVSPKPSIFRITLTNGQDYTLKWLGQDFEADISGKKYYIGQIGDYQQALTKLSILYQEGPMGTEDEEGGEGGPGGDEGGFGGAGSGGGDFPGGAEGEEGGEEGAPEEGEEGGSEEGGEDVGGEDIDFEADDSI